MRLIDADKLEELCDIMADKCDDTRKSIWHQFRTVVEWSPSVEPQRKKSGKIKMSDTDGIYYCCSECGEEVQRTWLYCPNCGAKMERRIDDE